MGTLQLHGQHEMPEEGSDLAVRSDSRMNTEEASATATAAAEAFSPTESLADFISAVSGDSHLKVEESFGSGYVRLRTAEAERRQAKHDIRCVEDIVIEMLRNARDAGARQIFLATTTEGDKRYLTFIDDGCGIPADMHDRIFEPRVTSKLETMTVDQWGVHGRGMALYSIHENSERAYVASSGNRLGASLCVEVDLSQVPEKADQSTYPQLEKDDEGNLSIGRGPHNIVRTLLEFALETDDVDVYYGTPTEIANILYQMGKRDIDDDDLLFCDDLNTLPVIVRLAACGDAPELARMSASIGIPVSERTAHRILADDLPRLKPAIDKVKPQKKEPADIDVIADRRGLKIAADDIEDFQLALESAFEAIGEKYYLTLRDIPKVTVMKDRIRVRFDVDKEI